MIVTSYSRVDGSSPFLEWVNGLDRQARAKIVTAIHRLELGNVSIVKGLDGGIAECRIDWGPGLRIYIAQDSETILLLWGGTKSRQSNDIEKAKSYFDDYKARKTQSE